jgi:hypothetical protein
MEIDLQKLKKDIIERANVGASKARAPELYHAMVAHTSAVFACVGNDAAVS